MDWFYWLIRGLVKWCFFRLWGGFRVLHSERFPKSGGVIVASNHTSFADPPAAGCASPRQLRFMAQAQLFVPIFGALIRRLGSFPVHRGEADTQAIRTALECLARGEALLVFPEGRRGDGKVLLPANKGISLLARKSGAWILPVGICNTHKKLPKGAKFAKFCRVTVVFGEPFRYQDVVDDSGGKSKEEFGDFLMERIAELMREGGQEIELSTKTTSQT